MITLSNGGSYSDIPFRDCRGAFKAASYVTARRFPACPPGTCPRRPTWLPPDRHLKKPEWLNDPLNYHDRGNIDFGSCSAQCFEQGDFFGLDDLFTEKPNVLSGLARIYASWISRFHVDGFRVDTAKHVNAAFFKLWVPKIRAAAKAAGRRRLPDLRRGDAERRDRPRRLRPQPRPAAGARLPVPAGRVGIRGGLLRRKGIAQRLADDDYFRLPDGSDPAFPTFLGNHDMGRAAQQILAQSPGLSPAALLQHVLLGYDLLYLLRGAPVVMYGDEVGMIGAAATRPPGRTCSRPRCRSGRPRRGWARRRSATARPSTSPTTRSRRSSTTLAALRDRYPALATGASVVRLRERSGARRLPDRRGHGRRAGHSVQQRRQRRARVTVATGTPGSTWSVAFGSGTATAGAGASLTLTIPPVSAILARPAATIPASAPAAPTLKAGPDSISSYYALTAGVAGGPVTVAFAPATRPAPGAGWRSTTRLRTARSSIRGATGRVHASRWSRFARGFDGATCGLEGAHRQAQSVECTGRCAAERHRCRAVRAACCCTSPPCRADGSDRRPTGSSTGWWRPDSRGGRCSR